MPSVPSVVGDRRATATTTATPVMVEISDRALPVRMQVGSARARFASRPRGGRIASHGIARRAMLSVVYTPLVAIMLLRARGRQRAA
jgi:hypothetical protein